MIICRYCNSNIMKTKTIGLLAILPLLMVAIAADISQDAFAQKADGSEGTQSPKSYGSATDRIVCGDSLCGVSGNESGNIGRAS